MDYGNVNTSLDEITQAGEVIWEKVFHVKIPLSATYTPERLKYDYRPSTGNKKIDQEFLREDCEVFLTIDAIFEHYRAGTAIKFMRNADLIEIYGIVNKYLLAWAKQLKYSINSVEAPIEDLLMLDQFASDIQTQSLQFNQETVSVNFGKIGDKLRLAASNSISGIKETLAQKAHENLGAAFTAAVYAKNRSNNAPETGNDPMSRWK